MRSKNRSTINFKKGKKTSITDTGHRSTDAISDYDISRDQMAIVRHARLEAGWYDWDNSMFIHEHRTTKFLKELTRICESKGRLKDHTLPDAIGEFSFIESRDIWGRVIHFTKFAKRQRFSGLSQLLIVIEYFSNKQQAL